jgi:CRP/FNR family transcriptional regulator, cyclic AMP receptor protein
MAGTSDLIKLLKAADLFLGLNDEQLQSMLDLSHELKFGRDELIFAQGDEGDKLYIVRNGQVEISVEQGDGTSRSQVYLGQGQTFGEMALIDQGKRSATVRAVKDGTIVDAIDRPTFLGLCDEDKAIGYVVMRNLALDLSFKLRHRNLDPNND